MVRIGRWAVCGAFLPRMMRRRREDLTQYSRNAGGDSINYLWLTVSGATRADGWRERELKTLAWL